jgi:hypothetical protein
MCRRVALLGALAVGLLVLLDGPTAEAGRRRARRCHTLSAPCPETFGTERANLRTYDLVRVYCCCNGRYNFMTDCSPEAAEAYILANCANNPNGCTSGFSTAVPPPDQDDAVQGSLCPIIDGFYAGAQAAPKKSWHVYCCCRGCWRFAGCFKDHADARCAERRCKQCCHCTNAIIAYGPMDPSVVPCGHGCR